MNATWSWAIRTFSSLRGSGISARPAGVRIRSSGLLGSPSLAITNLSPLRGAAISLTGGSA